MTNDRAAFSGNQPLASVFSVIIPDLTKTAEFQRFSDSVWYRRPGSNRYDQLRSPDFKSGASAYSATPAWMPRLRCSRVSEIIQSQAAKCQGNAGLHKSGCTRAERGAAQERNQDKIVKEIVCVTIIGWKREARFSHMFYARCSRRLWPDAVR